MFAEALLERYSSLSCRFKLVAAYGTRIKCTQSEITHSHEEADTLIPHQVLAAIHESSQPLELSVWSSYTDVFVLLLDLVSHDHLETHLGRRSQMKFVTGRGVNRREIDVVDRVKAVGSPKCRGLIGLHNFSGADWGGKFVGISKKKWVTEYMKLEDDDSIVSCLQSLGDLEISSELVDGHLPSQVQALERFVCQTYCTLGPFTLPDLRWKLFRTKNLEGEILPPRWRLCCHTYSG